LSTIESTGGVVAASTQTAAELGVKILKSQGGNAIDAAIAAAVCTSVVDPGDGGLGGGGIAIIYLSSEDKFFAVDFNCRCPSINLESDYPRVPGISEYTGYDNVQGDANVFGYKSISVPGIPAGLELLAEKFGRLQLRDLIQSSVELARHGFAPTRFVRGYIDGNLEVLSRDPQTFEIFGAPSLPYSDYQLVEADYAKTLETLGEQGASAFYYGEIADQIVQAMEKKGGLITKEDLSNYKATLGEPGKGTYRDHTIYFQSVGSGTPAVIESLNIAENFELPKKKRSSAEAIHLLIESMKLTWADRLAFDADPDFTRIPDQGLLSKEYASKRAEEINENHSIQKAVPGSPWKFQDVENVPTRLSSFAESQMHTSQVTVVDKDRNFVALTQTLWGSFGSMVTIPGTGIVMNNGQSRFDPDPKAANKPEPGKRVLSNMSPLLVENEGRPFAAAGTPGGRRIISTMVHFLSSVIDFRMKSDALNEPRYHCETSEPVLIEPLWIDKMPIGTASRLEALGHKLEMIPVRGSEHSGYPYISGPGSAILLLDGKLNGSADVRQPGGIFAE
jgi:gamma-glutamyltranspeptidase / glutathione hydrolase